MFVFASSDTTGEEKLVYTGLDASLLLILLAKYILPFLAQEKHLVSEGETNIYLFNKKEKTFILYYSNLQPCTTR